VLLRASLGFITAKILQYLTTIVILSRRAASCHEAARRDRITIVVRY
jgi:hypothetical protein